jgi:hypothetical protein
VVIGQFKAHDLAVPNRVWKWLLGAKLQREHVGPVTSVVSWTIVAFKVKARVEYVRSGAKHLDIKMPNLRPLHRGLDANGGNVREPNRRIAASA